jgi:hypothetical protein
MSHRLLTSSVKRVYICLEVTCHHAVAGIMTVALVYHQASTGSRFLTSNYLRLDKVTNVRNKDPEQCKREAQQILGKLLYLSHGKQMATRSRSPENIRQTSLPL